MASKTNNTTSRLFGAVISKWLVLSLALLAHPAFALEPGIEEYGKDLGGVRHVNATEAADILEKFPSVKILDVRTGKEFDAGHISDATNIDYYSNSFKTELDKLDKNVTWLLHCRSGARSGRSLPIMKFLGFKSIIHMDGGIMAWEKSGLPTL